MSKLDKKLEKWMKDPGSIQPEESAQDVMNILERHIEKKHIGRKGSEIVIHDPRLAEYTNASGNYFTIPTVNGRRVKKYYIRKRVIPILKFLKDKYPNGG